MKKLFILIFLICSYGAQAIDFRQVDAYTLGAPQIQKMSDLDKLVNYLVAPYNNDLEKARSLYAWIVYNISYDGYKVKALSKPTKSAQHQLQEIQKQGDVIKTRLGVCEDIANLYHQMAQKAGIVTQTVDGWAYDVPKRRNFDETIRHRWIIAKIADSWEYIDPTWAINTTSLNALSNISSLSNYKYEIAKRQKSLSIYKPHRSRSISSKWFLTPKDQMIQTHFPEQPQYQLQEQKITREEFLNQHKKGKKK